MKVLKFGGTSVGSVDAIKNLKIVVEREKQENKPLLVVCSAMSGITNALLEACEKALRGDNFQEILDKIENHHYEMIRKVLPLNIQNPLLMLVKRHFNNLEDLLSSVAYLGELTPKTKAKIISFGEHLSCPIVSAYLNINTPTELKESKDLIITNSDYLNAEVDFEKTNENISNWAKNIEDKVYVITGFIASDKKKNITTLGRGGSDYTASILGAALDARGVHIYTDVDGFMTADPQLVKNSYSLKYLTYQEAMELSYFGAKVIYPPSLVPLVSKKIPIWIKNTLRLEYEGTKIHTGVEIRDKALITGISSIRDISLVNIVGGGMIGLKGFSSRLFGVLSSNDINIVFITQASSEHSISFAIPSDDTKKAKRVLEKEFNLELLSGKLQKIELDDKVSIVAIVGERMKKTKGISGKLFNTLGKNNINVIAIAQGSSELNISVVISKEDLEKALNLIHDAFLLSPVKTYNVFCAGTGNIGKEFLNQIHQETQNLIDKHKIEIKVLGILNTRKMLIDDKDSIKESINISQWENLLEKKGVSADLKVFIDKIKKYELPNTVFVDNTSSTEIVNEYENLFNHNVSVVTCNKKGNSDSFAKYLNLKNLASKNGVSFLYETNVGAGLPIIKTIGDLMISGDEIIKIEAILSGTISYIFNSYTGDITFEEVVRNAQQLGFTEPDPRDDLGGLDFSRKMLILARECGLALEPSDVNIKNFLPEACINANSVEDFYKELKNNEKYFSSLKEKAEQENKKLRLIGTLENEKISIDVVMVEQSHPFFNLSESDNIISFTTNRYQNTPLVVKGPGAGASVTAAGVFADLVRVTNNN